MTHRLDEPPTAEFAPMDDAPRPQPLPEGMAVAAMVLGIIGVLTFCIVFVSLPCSILAIVFGEIAYRGVNRGQAGGKGMAVAGLITGFVGVFISLSTLTCYLMPGSHMRASRSTNPYFAPGATVAPAHSDVESPDDSDADLIFELDLNSEPVSGGGSR